MPLALQLALETDSTKEDEGVALILGCSESRLWYGVAQKDPLKGALPHDSAPTRYSEA